MKKQTVLITGASTGIGYELSGLFAKNGHDLVLVARSGDKLQALANDLASRHGVQAKVFPMDLAHPGSAQKLVEALDAQSIGIDILVNNAGFGFHGRFWEVPLQKQQEMMHLNIVTLTELARLLLPPMLERKQGRILNVASTAAFQPGPLMSVYYATKAYVLSFSEALAIELRGTGVTVTALCPGPTATEFVKTADMNGIPLISSGVMMSARQVAETGYRGLMREKAVVIPGWMNKMTAFLGPRAPRGMAARIVRRFHEKRA